MSDAAFFRVGQGRVKILAPRVVALRQGILGHRQAGKRRQLADKTNKERGVWFIWAGDRGWLVG